MYTMHENLARERFRSRDRDAQQLRVARELAASRRWHRVAMRVQSASERARRTQRRHANRAV